MSKGRLLVIEGLDGSGKATQAKLLAAHLAESGRRVMEITFPDYESDSSALVKMYLSGQFGDKPDDVNPYAASSFYAVDRYASYKTKWGSFYEAGGIVIADRYTTSNAVHQCSKLPLEQWDDFLRWAFDYEYRLLGLPAPDAVVYLQVDPAVSQKLMTGRYHGDESRKDVHEKDIEYLARSRRAAEYCAAHLGWATVHCTENGAMRTIEEIQAEVRALAVPVTLKGRSGSYLYGLCGQGSLILAGLVDYLCAQQKLRGAGFTVAVPAGQEQAALLENKGFQRAFALRCLPREVSRNLWSQAEFDSVTARKLCELRERFYPDTVQFPPEQMAVVLTDLYARGATIVSNEKGYGIYFRREDTLYFVELMADDDRSAEVLMEAAREKEVIVERAVITVGAAQNLFLGEGTRQDYGMIRFDAEPFDVEESYMRLMMES